VKPFEGKQARHLAVEAAYRVAQVVNPQADLINPAIDALIRSRYELPSFWTLNRMAQRVHVVMQGQLVTRVSDRLTVEHTERLDRLLVVALHLNRGFCELLAVFYHLNRGQTAGIAHKSRTNLLPPKGFGALSCIRLQDRWNAGHSLALRS
jgi:hypothetical protein